jgi:hypothetical protein
MTSEQTWKQLVVEKRVRQQQSIPKQWMITPPDTSVLDVSTLPETFDKLTAREIDITNTSVDDLLAKLANSELTSVEVTTAFYKRAIIAHQLVCFNNDVSHSRLI